jgi:tripeptidyl-peptidase I
VTVEEAENLLQTEYKIFENVRTGTPHIACDDYSVPRSVREHADFITPTVHFDAMIREPRKGRDLEERSTRVRPKPGINAAPEVRPVPKSLTR